MSKHTSSKSSKSSKSTKIGIIAIIIIIALVAAVIIYKNSKIKLLDDKIYSSFSESLEEKASSFKSNEDLKNFIINWSDKNNLKYSVDDAGNIIYEHPADSDKQDVQPTIICVNYNYKTAATNSTLLASGICCASSDLNAGLYYTIFFNNDNNLGVGYSGIDKKYFTDDAQVIYLDYGKNTSISRNSFGMNNSIINIKAELEPAEYDTAINISISGIDSNDINDSVAKQPNPVNCLSTVLQRLNSKSISYQLASINLPNSGNMYTNDLDVTILVNSYNQSSVTDYLDDRIKDFDKNYSDDFPNASYEYKVISNEAELPDTAFTEATSNSLNTLLYTIKMGAYRYTDDDVPDDAEVGDIYALNNITGINFNGSNIEISLYSSGKNNAILEKVFNENTDAAEVSGSTISKVSSVAPFKNTKDMLFNELQVTYVKVNDFSGPELLIRKDDDRYFNSCSYLQDINPNMDIVHMRADSDRMKTIASTAICFIEVQGKFLKL